MKKFEELVDLYAVAIATSVRAYTLESSRAIQAARVQNARAALLNAIYEATQARPCQCEDDTVPATPFDLERAKSGDAIEARVNGEWIDAHFVGIDTRNRIVLDLGMRWGLTPYALAGESEQLRMKATPREMQTVYLNIYPNDIIVHDNADDAEAHADHSRPRATHVVRIPKV